MTSLPDYTLIRGQRRSISIHVTERGLEVRAPQRASLRDIHGFLHRKQAWIARHMAGISKALAVIPVPGYEDGAVIHVVGRNLTLALVKAGRVLVKIQDQQLVVAGPQLTPERVRHHLKAWFMAQAEAVLPDRVDKYLPQIGKPFYDIQIKTLKRRWGSCTLKGELTFNWALMMAPLWVIDYVVVHELCHLKVMNHSAAFWREVGQIIPEYKRAVTWLKEYGPALKLP